MYNLTKSDSFTYPGAYPPYVLEILSTAAGIAAISSDQTLALFDPTRLSAGPTKTIDTNHGNIACARVYDPAASIVCTAGASGAVSLWDLRSPDRSPIANLKGCEAPITSIACDLKSQTIAVGTELANHQASILIWDARSTSQPRVQYHDIHSDDITELNFHPQESHILLSGATDGLVNISDTRIEDEDEVVVQAFNHGSIHHAGFLNSTEVWALSHDEKLALYDMADEQAAATIDYGDVRPVLKCQYVANVAPKNNGVGAIIGAGTQDQHLFQLIHLAKSSTWAFDEGTSVGLPGAHGFELVRSFLLFDQEQTVFTAGEDGQIASWRPG